MALAAAPDNDAGAVELSVEALVRARSLLRDAPLEADGWTPALDALADACGARSGQLVALNGQGDITLNWITRVPPTDIAAIEAFGLADPVVNPRLRLGLAGRPVGARSGRRGDDRRRRRTGGDRGGPGRRPLDHQVPDEGGVRQDRRQPPEPAGPPSAGPRLTGVQAVGALPRTEGKAKRVIRVKKD